MKTVIMVIALISIAQQPEAVCQTVESGTEVGAVEELEQYQSPDGKDVLTVRTNPPYETPNGDQHRTFTLKVGRGVKWSKTVIGEYVGPAEVVWSPDSSLVAIANTVHGGGENAIFAIDNRGRSPTVYHYAVDSLADKLAKNLKFSERDLESYKLWTNRLSLSARKVSTILWISSRNGFYKCFVGFTVGVSKLHSLEPPTASSFQEAAGE